ncbi:MAG: Gfo/Idh/MocA family oxidoreductase [Desulfamplus sp.]|nr:Gfo/Idh/MocA family oxidoreductase [Desulfamplus sp.]
MFKAAVVGCGMIGGMYEDVHSVQTYSHGKAYYEQNEISEIAFTDNHPERASSLAEKFKGVAYTDLSSLLKEFRPDCISVCTPDDNHFDAIQQILTEGDSVRLIFAEKPVVSTRDELEKIQCLLEKSNVEIIVHHNRRFDSAHQNLKYIIQNEELGKFIQGHIDYYGGWCHLGVHIIDVLQYFFEEPLIPGKMRYACSSKYPKDPTLHVDAEIAGGKIHMFGMDEALYQIVDINLKFETGQIKINDFGQEILVFRKTINKEQENVLIPDPDYKEKGMVSPIKNAIELIVDYLRSSNKNMLKPVGIQQAEITMNTLWNGVQLYEAQSQKS